VSHEVVFCSIRLLIDLEFNLHFSLALHQSSFLNLFPYSIGYSLFVGVERSLVWRARGTPTFHLFFLFACFGRVPSWQFMVGPGDPSLPFLVSQGQTGFFSFKLVHDHSPPKLPCTVVDRVDDQVRLLS